MTRIWTSMALGLAGILGATSASRADVIDGNWCSEKTGKTMQIQGPSIVTPGGSHIEGHYSRHAFDYTVPEREPEAGTPVMMRLLNENAVQVQIGASGAPEVWRRCEQTS
jgi:hypothetical protein